MYIHSNLSTNQWLVEGAKLSCCTCGTSIRTFLCRIRENSNASLRHLMFWRQRGPGIPPLCISRPFVLFNIQNLSAPMLCNANELERGEISRECKVVFSGVVFFDGLAIFSQTPFNQLAGYFHCCMFYFSSQQSCRVCRHKGLGTMLILCDDCNLAYHLQCLRPALSEVPEGHWSCPLCKVTESFRSEEEYNWVLAVGDLVISFRLRLCARVIFNLRKKIRTTSIMPCTLDEAEFKYIREKKSTKFAFENLVLVKDGFPSKFRFR